MPMSSTQAWLWVGMTLLLPALPHARAPRSLQGHNFPKPLTCYGLPM